MNFQASRKCRGFALVTALGVMVLLMIMAFGAATTVEFTFGFSRARLTDREYGELLRDSTRVLSERGIPSAGTQVEVMRTTTLGRRDVQVSATVQLAEIGTRLLGSVLRLRDGDQVVEFAAAPLNTGRVTRAAVYLMNTKGLRSAPILLQEKRP